MRPFNPRVLPLFTATAFRAISATGADAITDPIGFVNSTVAAGSQAAPVLSLVSPTLTRPVLWTGVIAGVSANTTGATTISVAGTPWSADLYDGVGNDHYVEVVSASNPGALSDITGTTASSIVTFDNLSAFAHVGDTIRIRKQVTISDYLGAANSAGLQAGSDSSTADAVLVYNGATPQTYWYYDGTKGGAPGWYDSSSQSAGNAIIGPNEGVAIQRRAGTSLTITSVGTAKTGNTLIPVQSGLNVLGTISATGLTLATSGLVNGAVALKTSNDAATADEVILYAPGSQMSYWYYDGSTGGIAGWYDLNFRAAGSTAIVPGTGLVVIRKAGGAFNWVLPAPSSF